MLRKVALYKIFGNLFVLFVSSYAALMYYLFVFVNILDATDSLTAGEYAFVIIFTTIFVLWIMCFIRTILTDPGRVPLYWGFYLDDPDHKRRRYCLICHIFKPERCHHCSACNRCVLNMDHHCPWLNNCVGFYNRKFFLLTLFYTLLLKYTVVIAFAYRFVYLAWIVLENDFRVPVYPIYMTLLAYVVNCTMAIVISFFFSFHVGLIRKNMTTIEHMERKRANHTQGAEMTDYDMGDYYNFIQIFGKNPWLWPFPVFFKSGKPVGDGVVWPQKPTKAQTYEMDQSMKQSVVESAHAQGEGDDFSKFDSKNQSPNPVLQHISPDGRGMFSNQTQKESPDGGFGSFNPKGTLPEVRQFNNYVSDGQYSQNRPVTSQTSDPRYHSPQQGYYQPFAMKASR